LTSVAALELGLLATLLLGPISWMGYDLIALPVYLTRSWERRWWPPLVLLSVPFLGAVLTVVQGPLGMEPGLSGALVGLGHLLALGAWLRDQHLTALPDCGGEAAGRAHPAGPRPFALNAGEAEAP
jgi:hypothetical protein